MKILVTHETSGRVRDAFLRAGHWAISCDLLPSDSDAGPHVLCRDGDHVFRLIEAFRPDILIGFPDCTFVCGSGLHWCRKDPSRIAKRDAATEHFRRLLDSDVPRICLENPVGHLSTAVRKPDQIIQPNWFGEDASKATCLWLKRLPSLMPTKIILPRIVDGKSRWANQTDSGQNRLGPSQDRAKIRSTTYQGIADAMANCWSRLNA